MSSIPEPRPMNRLGPGTGSGCLANILEVYAAIGKWIQANGYRITGLYREIYLQLPASDHPVTEIQYPVAKI